MIPGPPPHPLPALATFELAAYCRELEHSLTVTTTGPARALLRARLAEQESRARPHSSTAR
jgi:hypothetical protein